LIDRPAAFQGGTPQPDHRDLEPRILIPFDISEATSLTAASKKAGKSVRTLRAWCLEHGLGRRIGSHWHVSRVALAMFLDGDEAASARITLAPGRAPNGSPLTTTGSVWETSSSGPSSAPSSPIKKPDKCRQSRKLRQTRRSPSPAEAPMMF
jgi:hypothetical protein